MKKNKEIPEVSKIDTLRLEQAISEVENSQLRIQVAEFQLFQAQQNVQKILNEIQKEGFTLTRDSKRNWKYVVKK